MKIASARSHSDTKGRRVAASVGTVITSTRGHLLRLVFTDTRKLARLCKAHGIKPALLYKHGAHDTHTNRATFGLLEKQAGLFEAELDAKQFEKLGLLLLRTTVWKKAVRS